MRILSVNTVVGTNNTTSSRSTNSSNLVETANMQQNQHRRPSQKTCRLLQEMDNSAKELLAFLGELEDKRNTHSLEFVPKNGSDDTTRQIKICFQKNLKHILSKF